jgi:type IV secretory pathway TrbD component
MRTNVATALSNGWVQLFLIFASAVLAVTHDAPPARALSLVVFILGIAVFLIGMRGLRHLARTDPEPKAREYLRPLRSTLAGHLILGAPLWVTWATSCCAPITV